MTGWHLGNGLKGKHFAEWTGVEGCGDVNEGKILPWSSKDLFI